MNWCTMQCVFFIYMHVPMLHMLLCVTEETDEEEEEEEWEDGAQSLLKEPRNRTCE